MKENKIKKTEGWLFIILFCIVLIAILFIGTSLSGNSIFNIFQNIQKSSLTGQNNQTNYSYYPIWNHLTNAEKAIYHNNFNEFYQEFKEMEQQGIVKWHPEENAVIYGRGPNSDEYSFNGNMILFNNSIYQRIAGNVERIVNFDLNGNLIKQFGNRASLYYSQGMAIDKDYIFVTGVGTTTNSAEIERFYLKNATPAPFLNENGELNYRSYCGEDPCPAIYSDGKFIYQTDGQIRSRENLQLIGNITCLNKKPVLSYNEEGSHTNYPYSSDNNFLYLMSPECFHDSDCPSSFLCKDHQCILQCNSNLDCMISSQESFPECVDHSIGFCDKSRINCNSEEDCGPFQCIKKWCKTDRPENSYAVCRYNVTEFNGGTLEEKSHFFINSFGQQFVDFSAGNGELKVFVGVGQQNVMECEASSNCGKNEECMTPIDPSQSLYSICVKTCDVHENCSDLNLGCINHSIGFCSGKIQGLPGIECDDDLHCPENSRCIKKWCDNYNTVNIYSSVNGGFLKDFKFYQEKLFNEIEANANYLILKNEKQISIFSIQKNRTNSTENLTLLKEIVRANFSPYATWPDRPKIGSNGYFQMVDFWASFSGNVIRGTMRKPSGLIVNATNVTGDICRGSDNDFGMGPNWGKDYTDVPFENSTYRFRTGGQHGEGVNITTNITMIIPPPGPPHIDCMNQSDCQLMNPNLFCIFSKGRGNIIDGDCNTVCRSQSDCEIGFKCTNISSPSFFFCEGSPYSICLNDRDCAIRNQGRCVTHYCVYDIGNMPHEKEDPVKFMNFTTLYDYVGWPAAVVVDNSIIPWKLYVEFWAGPFKQGRNDIGNYQIIVYSVDPRRNFTWHELGSIVPPPAVQLPYWPYQTEEWNPMPNFGWFTGEPQYLENPYRVGPGKICLVKNEQGKISLYQAYNRNGRLIEFLSPKVLSSESLKELNIDNTLINLSQCEQHGGTCLEKCPEGYAQVDLSCNNINTSNAKGETNSVLGAKTIFDIIFSTKTKVCCMKISNPQQLMGVTASAIKEISSNPFSRVINFIKSIFKK